MAIKRIGVFTSGGDCSGMNACIRSVVRTAVSRGIAVTGIRNGYEGMINADVLEMDAGSVGGIVQTGGTILYTSRCEQFRTPEGRATAAQVLAKHNIDALVAIGGDGTYRGALALHQEHQIPVLGVPATIDRDIAATDYTIGYDTAVNTAVDAIDKIRDTATSHGRLFLVEVMGRHAGYLALQVAIASGAEDVLLPETPTDLKATVQRIEQGRRRGKRSSIIVVAEGDETGGAFQLAKQLKGQTGYPLRVVVLGHLQRGGAPTANERLMAARFGYHAVDALCNSCTCHALASRHGQIHRIELAVASKSAPVLDSVDLELIKILAI